MQTLAQALGVDTVSAQVLTRKPGDMLVIAITGNIKRSKMEKICERARQWLDSRVETRDMPVMVHNGGECVTLQGPESSDGEHTCQWKMGWDDLSKSYMDMSDAKRELQEKHDATVAELTKLRGELIVKTNEHAAKCRQFTEASDALDTLRAVVQALSLNLQNSEQNYTALCEKWHNERADCNALREKLEQVEASYNHICELSIRQSANYEEICTHAHEQAERLAEQAERLAEQDKQIAVAVEAEGDLIQQTVDMHAELAAENESLKAQVSTAHDRIAQLEEKSHEDEWWMTRLHEQNKFEMKRAQIDGVSSEERIQFLEECISTLEQEKREQPAQMTPVYEDVGLLRVGFASAHDALIVRGIHNELLERLEGQDKQIKAQAFDMACLQERSKQLWKENEELYKRVKCPVSVERYNALLHLEILVDKMLVDVPMSATLIERLDWFTKWLEGANCRLSDLAADNESLKAQVGAAHDRIKALEKEIEADNKIIEGRTALLQAIPPCEMHGDNCVSGALEWIDRAKENVRRLEAMERFCRGELQ